MITQLRIANFKSLVDFQLPNNGDLKNFICLIGLNGAGKSTLLQAFEFIAHILSGQIGDWLIARNWKGSDLLSKLKTDRTSRLIDINISIQIDDGKVDWEAKFNPIQLKCTFEKIIFVKGTDKGRAEELLKVSEGNYTMYPEPRGEKIPFEYKGSILSSLIIPEKAHEGINAIKKIATDIHSLELLSPQLMRRSAKKTSSIGSGGENLSGFLSSLTKEQMQDLLSELKYFYPHLENIGIKPKKFGWKSFEISEDYGISRIPQKLPFTLSSGLKTEAPHINDGLLRIVAILALTKGNGSFFLFDEIENGVNPSLVDKLMTYLVDLGQKGKQVIVTTHSPLILNYLPDAIAMESVFLLYKTPEGKTESTRYFDQPETKNKLEFLGPGEVFADTDMKEMVSRLSSGTAEKI